LKNFILENLSFPFNLCQTTIQSTRRQSEQGFFVRNSWKNVPHEISSQFCPPDIVLKKMSMKGNVLSKWSLV